MNIQNTKFKWLLIGASIVSWMGLTGCDKSTTSSVSSPSPVEIEKAAATSNSDLQQIAFLSQVNFSMNTAPEIKIFQFNIQPQGHQHPDVRVLLIENSNGRVIFVKALNTEEAVEVRGLKSSTLLAQYRSQMAMSESEYFQHLKEKTFHQHVDIRKAIVNFGVIEFRYLSVCREAPIWEDLVRVAMGNRYHLYLSLADLDDRSGSYELPYLTIDLETGGLALSPHLHKEWSVQGARPLMVAMSPQAPDGSVYQNSLFIDFSPYWLSCENSTLDYRSSKISELNEIQRSKVFGPEVRVSFEELQSEFERLKDLTQRHQLNTDEGVHDDYWQQVFWFLDRF